MALHVAPTTAALGAIVTGIDCRVLDADGTAALRRALLDRLVICIRGQRLDAAQYLRAMSRLGHPRIQREGLCIPGFDEIGIVSTEVKDALGDGKRVVQGESWHTDESFKASPPSFTTLYGVTLPSSGGDTQFVNMYMAYDDLAQDMKRRIDPLMVAHRYDSSRKRGRIVTLSTTERARLPEVTHPLARVHPETGRKALYLNPNRMECIVGMSRDQSDALLDQLIAHAVAPKYQYRHQWLDGDIVIWDDRCTMHKANPDIPAGERRVMHRIVLAEAA